MKGLYIAISLIILAFSFCPKECSAHGFAHGGAGSVHVPGGGSYIPGGGGVRASQPGYGGGGAYNNNRQYWGSGNNWGRQYWRYGYYWRRPYWGGGYGYYQPDPYSYETHYPAPVDSSYDDWNRAEIKRLGALPTSAFVKDYSWTEKGEEKLAVKKGQQVAAKNASGTQ